MSSIKKNYKIITLLFFLAISVYVFWQNLFPKPEKPNTVAIQKAIQKGKAFLKGRQTYHGAICDSTLGIFNVWETILSAQTLYNIDQNKTDTVLIKVLQYLKKSENAEGLVCHNNVQKNNYCIETSAIYLQLLADLAGKESVQKRANVIAKLQQKNGSWLIGNPDVKEALNFPTVTAFALNILQKAHTPVRYPKEALAWLVGKQREEGHWSFTWEYYDLPAYGLWAISEVIAPLKTPDMQAAKSKAIQYILKSQQADGTWEYGSMADFKTPSKELEVALSLASIQNFLAHEKNEPLEYAAYKAIQYLLKQQTPSGAWEGGFFPAPNSQKKEYIFATAMALRTLQRHLNQTRKND